MKFLATAFPILASLALRARAAAYACTPEAGINRGDCSQWPGSVPFCADWPTLGTQYDGRCAGEWYRARGYYGQAANGGDCSVGGDDGVIACVDNP